MRIAVGGFQHETNTFAPTKARYEDFVRADAWPGMSRGTELQEAVAGINLPVTGFLDAAKAGKHEISPLLWCSATPLAHVEEDAYERIADMLLRDLTAAMPVDALYLDLHGAMVAEHVEDGEGELLRRVRELVGPALPVVASLDLHANVTAEMARHADAMVAFRTYPHIDMAETGARALELIERIGRDGAPAKAMRKIPYLIPLVWQSTLSEPAAGLYRLLESVEHRLVSASFAMGFPPADIPACGPAILAYAANQKIAAGAADELALAVVDAESSFHGTIHEPDDGVRRAMEIASGAAKPVILVDTQDNPGAGTNADTVGLLEALARNGANAVLGLLCDPRAAAMAHAAGEGAEIETAIGAWSGLPRHRPYAARFRVERLGDGAFTATGPFYRGSRMRLGAMALLNIVGTEVRVALSTVKQQAADQAMFRHLGVEPARQRILALKSTVHFRADFQALAQEILIVAAPGPNPVDHRHLAYRRLRRSVRIMPLGPEIQA